MSTKLDELPQLFNIISGNMSFVGPRPQLIEYVNRYTPEQMKILDVPPGITDYSSIEFSNLDHVVGNANHVEVYDTVVFPRSNELRLKYVYERASATRPKVDISHDTGCHREALRWTDRRSSFNFGAIYTWTIYRLEITLNSEYHRCLRRRAAWWV